ncbi:MAG TPA: hypothetical protein VFR64_06460 [Methylomirabilota bacterium]|nr:hypothetical protein [Methylomirabilota bacterium]
MGRGLTLSVLVVLALAAPATAERPFRVVTEDAYATQCRSGVCATVQVTRSTFSDGNVETTLFFSAEDELGVPIPVFPQPFVQIESAHFAMDPLGLRATLNYHEISVAWGATDDFASLSSSTRFVREKTENGFTWSRLSEREQQLSAAVEGVAGSVPFDTGRIPESEGFGSASLTRRTTISRTRLE